MRCATCLARWNAATRASESKSPRECPFGKRRAEKRKAPTSRGFSLTAGGASRSRTGLHGFAGRCITALLSRRKRTAEPPQVSCMLNSQLNRQRRVRRFVRWPLGPPNKKGSVASPNVWSGRRVSNSRPQPWQGCALPTELLPHGPAIQRFAFYYAMQNRRHTKRCFKNLERETSLELATSTLARLRSTN
jgi:hypothetical protein